MKIFLVGFMGSGKSHWGKLWAEKTQLQFFDLDELVEAAEERSVSAIFDKQGEDYFREKEKEILRDFFTKDNCIVACGGGTACYHGNMDWMNEIGITVYLSASPNEILDRVLLEQGKRPLIKDLNKAELIFFIEQKLKEREAFYKQARIILTQEELDDTVLARKTGMLAE